MTRFIRFRKSSETITFDSPVPDFRGNSFLPTVAVIPLLQHEGSSSVPVVSPGERVREGQLLARGDGHDSAHIHSSIPGVVQEIRNVSLPDGKMGPAAVIRLSGSFDILGRKTPNYPWRTVPESEILRVIEEKGVINTFESAVPLVPYLRFAKKEGKPVLVLRFFDNDPTCELDAFLVRNNLQPVLEGTALIAKSMDAGTVYIVHEGKSLPGSARQMLSEIFLKDVVKLIPVKTRYPAGNAAYISGLIPEKNLVLIDPVTALSAFDAVVHNQPVLQRFVSVSGPSLDSPAILKVRIGTPVGDIIEECGGFRSDPARIVVNGLLAGTAIYDLDTPVTKYTKSLHIMDRDTCPDYTVRDCIHCGRCLQVCPVSIDPMRVITGIRKDAFSPLLIESIVSCQNCGCCAVVCPSRIPLNQIIKEASLRLKGKRK